MRRREESVWQRAVMKEQKAMKNVRNTFFTQIKFPTSSVIKCEMLVEEPKNKYQEANKMQSSKPEYRNPKAFSNELPVMSLGPERTKPVRGRG
jgi:hypothetical protein